MIAKGRKPKFCGMKNGRAKLNLVQVQEIRTRYIPGQIRIVDLASEYCVSKSQIWNIVTKAQWNDFPSALS